MNIFYLCAQSADNSQAGNPWMTIVVYGVLIAALVGAFIFMNRKQKKQDKEIADMRSNLRVGDEVTTTGGIVGRIVKVNEDTVIIETSRNGTKIRFLKSAVARVDVPVEAASKSSKEDK